METGKSVKLIHQKMNSVRRTWDGEKKYRKWNGNLYGNYFFRNFVRIEVINAA